MQLETKLLTLFVTAGLCAAQQHMPVHELYLLAATPTVYRPVTYPATLYSIDDKQKLHLVRKVVPGNDGVEFVLASSSFLAIGHPSLPAKALTFVNYGTPSIPNSVHFAGEIGADPLGAFLVDEPASGVMVGLACFKNGVPCLFGIELQPVETDKRAVHSLGWSELENIRFEGSTGGADIQFGTTDPTLGGEGLYVNSPQGAAFIAQLKTAAAEPGIPATLLCANEQFVVASKNNVSPDAPTSTKLWIYNRRQQTASDLLVPGDRNRYRIFGKRLAVIVSYSGESPTLSSAARATTKGTRIVRYSNSSGAFDPGENQQRAEGTADLPPVRSFYHYPAQQQWFPGKLLVIDLLTHEKIEDDTAQADSEILHIDDQRVLYRVNDQIYSTHISHEKFDAPTLLVKDEDVPEIHWIFWGPPPG